MKKAFLISVIAAAVLFLAGVLSEYTELFGKIAVGIGVFFFIIAGLTSGAFISGSQMQANFHSESKQSRAERRNMMFVSGVVMIPQFIAGYFLLTL
ncbi:hypothetical protein GCM10009001_09710 [Virgibacillus siamensis]|uniref:DUF5316 domain-containing protein n=1 Tax=Virgibacillus siamensis TaxID=480071 RepID=A0ABP3QU70_9BACI